MPSAGEPSSQPRRAHETPVSSTDQTLNEAPTNLPDRCSDDRRSCGRRAPDERSPIPAPIKSDDLFSEIGGHMKDLPYSLHAEENGNSGRIIQSFHGPSWIALREMDREIIKATKELMDGHRTGNRDIEEHAAKLRKLMPERTAFVASLVTLENLQQPSETEVEVMIGRYPTGKLEKRQEILPLTSPGHWKSLRRISRQQRLANSLPFLAKLATRPLRASRTHVFDGEGYEVPVDMYREKYISAIVLVLCSIVIGAFVCIPIVILGMDVGSKSDKVAVIVLFIISFGVCSAYWLDDPAIAIASMLGFAASLVNVSV